MPGPVRFFRRSVCPAVFIFFQNPRRYCRSRSRFLVSHDFGKNAAPRILAETSLVVGSHLPVKRLDARRGCILMAYEDASPSRIISARDLGRRVARSTLWRDCVHKRLESENQSKRRMRKIKFCMAEILCYVRNT